MNKNRQFLDNWKSIKIYLKEFGLKINLNIKKK